MVVRLFSVLALVLCCSFSYAEETVEIPLDQIWAYHLPGTQDIRDLERKPENYNELTPAEIAKASLVEQIRRALSHRNRQENETAGTAFVVVGANYDALGNTHDIFTGKAERRETVPSDHDLTLVFYTYSCGRFIRLDKVSRRANEITIDYHFEAHNTLEMTTHFALIPLQQLPLGEIQVNINQLSGTGPKWGPSASPIEPSRVRQIVCNSFDFSVLEQEN